MLRTFAFATSTMLAGLAHAAGPLAQAPSAFLRAHADSPVQWMTWGDDAFARAKAEGKPVFLAIGSFTSEFSRAMREQSFARAENAEMLNENFVCIVVDRDDHPEVAAFHQRYVGVIKQKQGWPLNIWLTPELEPFDGATYLPPTDEWGNEGFPNALKRVVTAWQSDPDAQRLKAREALDVLTSQAPATAPSVDKAALGRLLTESAEGWLAVFDETNGGFGDPPKRPEPELLRFLLREGGASREAALKTLRALTASSVRDPLDGGFFRYASDAGWRLPYFQKTLSDQARIALACLDARQIDDDPLFSTAIRGALSYALTLGDSKRGFAGAEDGTPPGIVPSFLWTEREIRAALGNADAAAVSTALGATDAGTLEADAYLGVDTSGKNVLFGAVSRDKELSARIARGSEKLLQLRGKRPAPLRDDIATAGAHGALLAALARAGAELSEPGFASAAAQVFALIREKFVGADGQLRSRPGRASLASPRDHALVIDGLLAFHKTSTDSAAHELALKISGNLAAAFGDESTGRYFASPEPLPQGIGARVHAPAPDASDLPGAETAALLTFVGHELLDPDARAALAGAIAADIQESFEPARGDQLLALQTFVRSP